MRTWLRREVRRLLRALRQIDTQVAVVLTLTPALVLLQQTLGSRAFYWTHLEEILPAGTRDLGAWGWWFGMQGVTGFVIPAGVLLVFFRRRPRDIGMGRGDMRLALGLAAAYLPLVAVGTWVLSADPAFQSEYPHLKSAASDWGDFLIYEALFLFYWIGWEYLWRGFVLFGTARAFGYTAIFVQMVPFAILHLDKPPAEAALSIAGGLALGALVWRCRAFWIAVPIHAAQMLILDLWCTLRLRSGATNGIGLEALGRVLGL
jgi:hypothetical protein